mmetsp:Transcript_81080/g.229692  ORF Transcript_81080/g.229692 Transcript_81080/m.229692 type:complete len:330 (+) Transcript_81080:116-1105(+)
MTVPLAVVLWALVASSDAVRDSLGDMHGDRGSEPGEGMEEFTKILEATEACCVNHENDPWSCYNEGVGSPDTQAQLLKLPMKQASPFLDEVNRVFSTCAALEKDDMEEYRQILNETEGCCVNHEKNPYSCYREGIGFQETQLRLLQMPMTDLRPFLPEMNRVFLKCAELERQYAGAMLQQQGTSSDAGAVRQQNIEKFTAILRATETCCVSSEKDPWACYNEGIGSPDTQAQLLKLPMEEVSPLLAEQNRVFSKCASLEKDPMEEYRKLLRTTRDCCVNREKAPYTCYQEGIGSSETQAQLLKLPLDDVSPFLAEVNHVFLKCSALEKQ